MRTRRVKLADLGKKYHALRDSEYNFFKSKRRPIKVKYKTFKLKKYDGMTKRANIIYAKYKFAQRASDHFNHLVDQELKRGFKGESRRTLRKALRRKSVKNLKSRQRLSASYEALMTSLNASRELVTEANNLIKLGGQVKSNTTKVIKRRPDKAILADQVALESKRSSERLTEVIRGAPKLVKSLTKSLEIAKVARSVSK